MSLGQLRRGGVTLFLLVGALFAQTAVSTAQAPGSELTEDVSSEVAGAEASIPLLDVSAFAPAGEAVFEPGTINEETFTYSSVDAEDNLLVGLTRPAPISHSAGVFIQAPQAAPTSSPEPTASSDSEDQPEADQEGEADSSDAAAAEGNYDPVCEAVAEKTCAEVIADTCGVRVVCEVVNDPRGRSGVPGTAIRPTTSTLITSVTRRTQARHAKIFFRAGW